MNDDFISILRRNAGVTELAARRTVKALADFLAMSIAPPEAPDDEAARLLCYQRRTEEMRLACDIRNACINYLEAYRPTPVALPALCQIMAPSFQNKLSERALERHLDYLELRGLVSRTTPGISGLCGYRLTAAGIDWQESGQRFRMHGIADAS